MPASDQPDDRGLDLDDDLWIAEDDELTDRGISRRTRTRRPRPHRPGQTGSVRVQPSRQAADPDHPGEPTAAAVPAEPVAPTDDGRTDRAPAAERGEPTPDDHEDDVRLDDDHHGHDGHDDFDEEEEHERDEDADHGPEKLPRWVLVLGFIALFVGIVVGGSMFWYQRQVNPPGPLGPPVEVEIPRGSSAGGLGGRLADHGVVRNALLFNFWATRNDVGQIDAGIYVFNENMSYEQARETLRAGPSRGLESAGEVVKVLIPEGFTIARIEERIANGVDRFSAETLEEAFASGEVTSALRPEGVESWEGLLFPATYDLGPKTSAVDFLNTLTSEMERRVKALDPDKAVAAINERYGLELEVYDLLTVASLVQSEAGGEAEAAKIASVIYNRLEQKSTAWTLGIDAADEYGAALEDMTPGEYRETDGPYNMRRMAGLPPTPISAPGDYALKAAFAPEDTEYMYYVLTAPGVHTFAVTDAEFQAAKAQCKAAGLGCG